MKSYNPDYTYPNIELWNDELWREQNSLIDPVFQWIGHNSVKAPEAYQRQEGDPCQLPGYQRKSNSVDVPEIIAYWRGRGLEMTTLEQGCKYWISMVPTVQPAGRKMKLLVVLCRQDGLNDPWWAMEVQQQYAGCNERAAADGGTIVVYLTADGADEDRIFGNILQEASVLYPVDLDEIYLDVSLPVDRGQRLSEIPGFRWVEQDGTTPLDPDGAVETKWGRAVLNISGRWGSRESLTRGLVMNQKMNEGNFDRQRLIHSEAGAKMAQAIVLEHRFSTVHDPAYQAYWAAKGVAYRIHETAGRRWTIMSPAGVEEPLPLVLVMQEVYRGNEHLAVTAASYFSQASELAAQGQFHALFFALEDPDSNDLLADILEEAASTYPVDRTRVYVMGHSHDGWFARFFAYRHPRQIAAVVTMGNAFGLPTVEDTGNDKLGVSEAEAAEMERHDMPLMNINGEREGASFYPETQEGQLRWAREWQRRLRACRCPVKPVEEILAARTAGREAERRLGIPGEQAMTIWSDGFASYIVDIQNTAGRYHLRVAATENMPHTVTPPMIDLAWGFLRQFARDLKTGEILELGHV